MKRNEDRGRDWKEEEVAREDGKKNMTCQKIYVGQKTRWERREESRLNEMTKVYEVYDTTVQQYKTLKTRFHMFMGFFVMKCFITKNRALKKKKTR